MSAFGGACIFVTGHGADGVHGATTEETRRFIEFAAEYGFDGILVEGWNLGWDGNWYENGDVFSFTEAYPDFDIEALADYARQKASDLSVTTKHPAISAIMKTSLRMLLTYMSGSAIAL